MIFCVVIGILKKGLLVNLKSFAVTKDPTLTAHKEALSQNLSLFNCHATYEISSFSGLKPLGAWGQVVAKFQEEVAETMDDARFILPKDLMSIKWLVCNLWCM